MYKLYFMHRTTYMICVGIVISLIRTFAFGFESKLVYFEDDKGSYFLFTLGESLYRFTSWSFVV